MQYHLNATIDIIKLFFFQIYVNLRFYSYNKLDENKYTNKYIFVFKTFFSMFLFLTFLLNTIHVHISSNLDSI